MNVLRMCTATVLAIVAAAALTANPVSAQQTESRIVGKLVDDSGAALPGATVIVTSKQTGAPRVVVSEGDGSYAVTNLGPGSYTVQVELAGFASKTRDVVLGIGQVETLDLALGVAALQEAVTVSASAAVIDLSSAKIGVNVSPEEVQNLPVNGRNFANLMTLATGATSDGNGGWASVRFNGKSNQQNYLNFDGIDGTYVWDASPGYLNATGSQFRLQQSMESVAEFRVNSGLAPAESGLGAGGNITVVSKSGGNRFTGSLFEYRRDDALDAASRYDGQKQKLKLDQFGGSFGGPIAQNRTFFFASFEGLRQRTGLRFTEALPSTEARRRILAGEPVGRGAGQNADRTRAVAPLLSGFPEGTVATSNPLLALATLDTEATQEENTLSFRVDHRFTDSQSFYLRYLMSDGDLDTPDRTVTPRRVRARQRPQNLVFNYQSIIGGSELPGAVNLTVGYTGSQGKDMFLRGVGNTLSVTTRTRQVPAVGQVDYKTSGCLDGLVINGNPINGCGYASYNALQISATRRFQAGFTGGLQYQYSRNRGTTQGSNEAATTQNTFDYETEYGTNPQDIPHTFNGSLIYQIPGEGLFLGGWRVGGIVNARSGVPINVTIARPDNITVGGATVTNIPGGNSRGTQRPDVVPGVNPYLRDGVRWLNPAAFTTPQPGTFGNLPRNALRGPNFWQADLMFSKDFRFLKSQGLQVRVEVFNIANRLNYENPAASLPNGTPGVPFTDAQTGTFGYMLGPLNRTVGLGTARQTQISLRYSF